MSGTEILILLAFALLILAAIGVHVPRVHLGWAGLAVLVLALWVLPIF